MNSDDLETIEKADYVIRNVCKQVYNVFPFVGIKCESSWDEKAYDIIARWYYKGDGHAFKYTISDDALGYFADLDYIVYSLVHRICDEIMRTCNNSDEEEVTNAH